jgi:glutathione S-transferase
MILIGQYDSPFVRRVAVALLHYEMPYEHRPWSTFGDAERLAAYNPLRRVPTLVLDNGEVLIESAAILDHLDESAGPARALIARQGEERRAVLRLCALATGLCDKMVSLVYERVLHEATSPVWTARCEAQIASVLDVLEKDRAKRTTAFWFGDSLTHADIAVTCAMRFLREAHGEMFDLARWPALAAHADHCEGLGIFRSVVQRFTPPGRGSD